MAGTGGAIKGAFERERRYRLPGGDIPGLAAIGPISPARIIRLNEVHLDTPKLDLFRAGVVLRRETGGDNDGWHLKAGLVEGAQIERRMPMGAGCRVPSALRDVVADLVLDRPLLPVLSLRIERTVHLLFDDLGGTRAEVSVDRVTARLLIVPHTRKRWVEVAAGLARGEPDQTLLDLDRHLRNHGLTTAPNDAELDRMFRSAQPAKAPRTSWAAADAVCHSIGEQLGRLQALEPGLVHDRPEAVHDTRVVLRRLRSILGAFGPLIASAGAITAARCELRWAGLQLSGARDLEVLGGLLTDTLAVHRTPGGDRVVDLWAARARRHQDEARARVLAALASPRWDALHARLMGLAVRPKPTRRGCRRAGRQLRRFAGEQIRRVDRRRRAALRDPTALAGWHEVRKAAKAARYALEVVADLKGATAADRAVAAAWKSIATTFGEVQDVALARAALAELPRGEVSDVDVADVDLLLTARGVADLDAARAALDDALGPPSAPRV